MKKIFAFLFSAAWFASYAQDPSIVWQKTIGGSSLDVLTSLKPTADGGYIMGGYSTSNISGDKTENSNGGTDIWVVKTNASGAIEWQNTIGGSGFDSPSAVIQTSDGGYVVFAGSDSNISGDKTENSRGGLDYWIIKLDAIGNIVWQHTYGGSNPDFDVFGQQTADGGYIVAGYSDSDVSGDKTDPTNGQRDYWVMKLDALGDIVWQNSIGGALVDRVQAVSATADGGYVVGGFSFSSISGDKTENSRGASDYWVVKLDANGAILWQSTIGGAGSDALRDLILTADGGYLIGGYSNSNLSGDKTENSNGDYDYWVVKLDANGQTVWQNTIGGANIDYLRQLTQLPDGSYLAAGYSNSNISGDKTEASNGGYDFWLVKLDTNGNIITQNTIGGAADESGPYVIPTPDSGFVMACSSASNISGDKSQNSVGAEDYWIFKTDAAILASHSSAAKLSAFAFPNPAQEKLTVILGQPYQEVSATITDLKGAIVHRQHFENTEGFDLTLQCQTGVYLLSIQADGVQTTLKVVKD